jgi:hypothetical protein
MSVVINPPRPNKRNSKGEVLYEIWLGGYFICGFWFKPQFHLSELFAKAQLVNKLLEARLASKGINNPFVPDVAYCWAPECNRAQIDRDRTETDGDYGNFCSFCGNSLRAHPFFGEGTEFDKGDAAKWYIWKNMNPQQQANVYYRYGFPVPQRLRG